MTFRADSVCPNIRIPLQACLLSPHYFVCKQNSASGGFPLQTNSSCLSALVGCSCFYALLGSVVSPKRVSVGTVFTFKMCLWVG